MKRAARIDDNQRDIVAAFEHAGAHVLSLAPIGHGAPDLLVEIRGQLTLVEVKSMRGTLTLEQRDFHRRWSVRIIRSAAEALAMMGITERKPVARS